MLSKRKRDKNRKNYTSIKYNQGDEKMAETFDERVEEETTHAPAYGEKETTKF